MDLSPNEFTYTPTSSINIPRDLRQRSEILQDADFKALTESIRLYGILNPLLVEVDERQMGWRLIAGERRLTAAILLDLPTVPIRIKSDLTQDQSYILELEENVHRKDLPWQDLVRAVSTYHTKRCAVDPEWSPPKTAECLCLDPTTVRNYLSVANRAKAVPTIFSADTIGNAINQAKRATDRAITTELDLMHDTLDRAQAPAAIEDTPPKPAVRDVSEDILCLDSIAWMRHYSGDRFNLIHCDFPYGVHLHDSDFIVERWGEKELYAYNDTKEIYFNLLGALTTHANNFMAKTCHIIFWYSMQYHQETVEALSKIGTVFPHPIIWHKSDNKGLISDPNRRPRHVYETALLVSRGDRTIVRSISDVISAPTQRGYHLSIKPVPVLKTLFAMVVDEHTSLLDPTCGSGSALRAAEDLGAARVLGIERNQKFADEARHDLLMDRNKRALHRQLKEGAR